MSTDYESADGHWRVRAIILDGTPLLRVEHDSPVVGGKVATHGDGAHRHGPTRTGGKWWLIADVTAVEQVASYVPLDRLTLINHGGKSE